MKQAEARGVPRSRIVITEIIPHEIMDVRGMADLSLDTEFTGFTTRAEMFWVGVPTITLAGAALHNRGGYSLTNAVCGNYCTHHMVVNSLEEYERKAIELGKNRELLLELKAKSLYY